MRIPVRILAVLLLPVFAQAQSKPLDYYLQAGLTNSPVRKDLYNQSRSNLVDSAKIVAGQKPRVDGNGVATFAPYYKGFGYDNAVTNGGVFSTLLSVSQPLLRKPVLDNQYQSLQLQNRSLDVSVRLNDADLKYSISSQYIAVYGDYATTVFQEAFLNELRKQAGILLELTRRGVYQEVDYLSFQNSIHAQEVNFRQARQQWRNDLYALNLLCGISDTALIKPEMPDVAPPAAAPDPGVSLFLQSFLVDSLKLLNARRGIDLNYRPRVNWFADAGFISSFQFQAYKNFGMSAGLSVTVPVYDGHQRLLEYQKLQLAEATRTTYKQFAHNQFSAETAQLQAQIRETAALIAEIDHQIESSGALLDLLHIQLNRGNVHMPDLLLATQNWISLKSNRLQAETARLQLLNRLKYRRQ
jgi:outer membrane protein TolC